MTLLAICLVATGSRAASVTERLDVTYSGVAPNGSSWWPVMSADGRFVAFHSWASNLVPSDRNGAYDIFVRDRFLGTTTLVSVSSIGTQADADSIYPAISADGKSIAFISAATNLASDANGKTQVYVRDWLTGTTELVSVSPTGEPADADCEYCSISGDGRYVVFDTASTNLAPGTGAHLEVYLRDRAAGTTQLISVSTAGDSANWDALKPRITPDGRYVVFCSLADNIVPNDTNAAKDLFLRDLMATTTERISVADVTGEQGNARSAAAPPPAITPDARFIAFASEASNLVASDSNGLWDIFLRDRETGRTELISASTAGEPGNDISGHTLGGLAISADGRYVAFPSLATNLVPGDTQAYWDAFIRDREAGTTDLLSASLTGGFANGDSGCNSVCMSADGRSVVFDSRATDLVPDVSGSFIHVYLRTVVAPTTTPIVTIDGGAAYSTSPNVTLAIDYGLWSRLRFRNESGDWTDWEPSAPTRAWVLSPGDGRKQVYVQGWVPYTESTEAFAAIVLDTAPPTDLSISIDGGAATTVRRAAELALSASGAAEMRFRNESDDWSDWERFAQTKDWTLSAGREMKIVTFQCRDAAGNVSGTTAATIDLILFTDIPGDFWAYSQIASCADSGIVTGYSDGTYQPNNPVTRDQMAVYIARALAGGAAIPPGPATPSFSDVPTAHWAYDCIEYAISEGVVQGYAGGLYQPAQLVDRAQMAVYIARSICTPRGEPGLAAFEAPAVPTFPDVPAEHWAYRHIEYARAQGVVKGYLLPDPQNPTQTVTLYQPDWIVTRDQMAVYIQQAFRLPA